MEIFKNIDNQMDLKENSNGMIRNNVPLNQNNIYQNNISQQARASEKDIVGKSFNNARRTMDTGVVPRHFNQSILNSTNKFELHQQYQDFKDQPSENEKFVISPMSGQKMLKEDFGHQNMVPFFGSNIKQNLSEHSTQTMLENHTGSIKNFRNKQEIP